MHENNSGFALKLFEPKKLKQINEDGRRLYVTEGGEKYPSVTTALSLIGRKKLNEWRRRVGFDKANKIGQQAARAGTAVHNVAEKYVLGEDISKENPIALSKFNTIKPYLDNNVDEIYGIELRMYSDELKTAGTADLICRYNGKNTLLDFKTSKRRKSKEDILSYFLQCSAYSIMAKEHYNFDVEQIVILMTIAEEPTPEIFVEDINNYINKTRKYFEYYHQGLLSES